LAAKAAAALNLIPKKLKYFSEKRKKKQIEKTIRE